MDHANFLAVSVYCIYCAWCSVVFCGAGGDRWRAVADLRRNTIITNNHCLPVCNESVIVGVVYGSVWCSGSLPAIFLAQ